MGESAPAVWLHVYSTWQEAVVHGRRHRATARVESRFQSGLAPARACTASRPAALGARLEHALSRRAGAAPARLPARRIRMDRLPRWRPEHLELPAAR